MNNNKKREFSVVWIIIIVVAIVFILVLGILRGVFWKSNPEKVNEYIDSVIDSVKEIIGVQDSPEQLKNDSILQNKSIGSSVEEPQDISVSGGGGGGESTGVVNVVSNDVNYTQYNNESYETLEELFDSDNPMGGRVNLYGVAFQISGVDMFDYFLFTDDDIIIENPINMLLNGANFHINVYNSIVNITPQSIVRVKGVVVDCINGVQGRYCISANEIN
ncbi:MAG: hypothetical protein KatS3mg002_0800 [Candidatus Woesearchaeota archaeon]|nr:MAG: hypothetical protein KatS3mg002_0800 [Candidatus Woesearchaeota archaeon]